MHLKPMSRHDTWRMLRRRCTSCVLLLAVTCASPVASAAPPAASAPARPLVEGVACVGLTVSDLDRSVNFYRDVLTFEEVSRIEISGAAWEKLESIPSPAKRVARLRLGDEIFELTEYRQPRGKPFPPDSHSNDRWFQHIAIIVTDMDKAVARLRDNDVRPASKAPQRLPDWNRNAAGIRAFYFRDPDGHYLEILAFPPGKGQARWHQKSERLFLGIDHTAIVVADTQASLRFYRDTLGFRIVGESENYGPEQEGLNNVPGAHLRITTLRAADGPAIELLEYLNPRDGRPYPPEARPNDLLYWQTTLVTASAGQAEGMLRKAGATFVSPGLVTIDESDIGYRRAMIVRDPDGHAMRIVQEKP